MIPVKTERSNKTYRGDDNEVEDLHVEATKIQGGALDGAEITYAVWEPDAAERAALAHGGRVKIGILFADGIYPMTVRVTDERKVSE